MIRQNRARWALSFADLSLLLLGFFVLLQASQANRDKTLQGLASYFGAIEAPLQADLPAARLFAPGEALLTPAGRAALIRAARPLAARSGVIRIQSIGSETGTRRFDAWDLSAARLGAVARALAAAGIAEKRLRIAGLAEQDESEKVAKTQLIRLAGEPQPAR